MSSKYDAFWLAQLGDLRELIGDAAQGRAASADFSSIRPLGDRASWAGTTSIRGAVVVKVAMAHLTSLARVVADAGLCVPWPDQTFVFSMSNRGVLTVRPQSLPASVIASSAPISVASPIVKTVQPTDGEPLDPAEACRLIHDVVTGLPRYIDPADVPIDNGLYFFFELGEDSPHGHPRITRIGNHPRAQDGLVARLRNHYATHRGAKNGSVFRRYLGGALLRRDGRLTCLDPASGKGHWERGDGQECDVCAPYERLVTERLRSTFSFSCVRIDDRMLRNHLEGSLIATVAQCPLCQHSAGWLGRLAYPEKMQTSGMWNIDFVDGVPSTKEDLVTLRSLARARSNHRDLSDTMLLIPCSGGKDGTGDLGLVPTPIESFLGEETAGVLAEGRVRAFERKRTSLDRSSAFVLAIARYSGQPYKTPGVLDAVLDAISRGVHVLIVSGGYGLLRAEEPIQRYNAQMLDTLPVWRSRIPAILADYVARNDIRRTFGAFSRVYSRAVPERLTKEDWRAVPNFDELGGGSAMTRVPERVAQLILELLQRDLQPAATEWTLSRQA